MLMDWGVNGDKVPILVPKAKLSPAQTAIYALELGFVEGVEEFKAELHIQPLVKS